MAAPEPIIDANPFSGTDSPGAPGGSISTFSRTVRLLNAADAQIRQSFLRMVGQAKGVRTLETIAALLDAGRIEEALDVIDDVALGFFNSINAAYVAAGQSTATVLRQATGTLIQFDTTSPRAVESLRANNVRLVRELRQSQRDAFTSVLQDGVGRGLRPDQIARNLRSSLGLTGPQTQAVLNYRTALEQRDSKALQRQLRDRRFDPTVRRAIDTDTPLTQAQINRMTERYQERMLIHRSNVIARTESLRSVNQGDEEMWQQGVERGVVDPADINTHWRTASDERVRSSHSFMNNQAREFGEPFTSGNGNRLRFPGDPAAPGSDTIQCRCVLDRRIPKRPRGDLSAVGVSF